MNLVLRLSVAATAVALIVVRFTYPDIEIDSVLFVYAFVALFAIVGPKGVARLFEAFGLPKARLEGIELPFLKYKIDEPTTPESPATATREVTDGAPKSGLRVPTAVPEPVEPLFIQAIKFIPIETIMFYQVMSAMMLSSITKGQYEPATVLKIEWGLFLFSVVFTAAYVRRLGSGWKEMVLASVMFAGWAFSLGGPFYAFAWYDPAYGGFVLLLLALALPLTYRR